MGSDGDNKWMSVLLSYSYVKNATSINSTTIKTNNYYRLVL